MADGPGFSVGLFFGQYINSEVDLPALLPDVNGSHHIVDVDFVADFGESFVENTPTLPAASNTTVKCDPFLAEDWFGKVHVTPRLFAFGNILGTLTRTIDIFNANLNTTVTWSSFVDNVGEGLDITDLPTLPTSIVGLSGLSLTLEVTTEGAPAFDTTIDFVFSTGTIKVPVSGRRVLMFPYPPEAPLTERLLFLTNILENQDGSEQRFALRKNPRQVFDMIIARDEGEERARIEFFMFDWQRRALGLPMWHESTVLTAAAAQNDLTITVDSTNFADYRVGGIALVLGDDEATFDALEIESFTATTITFKSGLSRAYSVGSQVFPIRTAILEQLITTNRAPNGSATYNVRASVLDNDSNLGDTSAFNTYESAVLLDDLNVMDGTELTEGLEVRLIQRDNRTGVFGRESPWTSNKRRSMKGFKISSRQSLWEVRRLLHALKGRQVSFWLPTFYNELPLIADLNSGTSTVRMKNVGYTQFVNSNARRNIIRVTEKDGTKTIRTIGSATEIDSTEEQLTVDSNWTSTIALADIEKVDFYEKVRIDSDSIIITHHNNTGEATITVPVRQVF